MFRLYHNRKCALGYPLLFRREVGGRGFKSVGTALVKWPIPRNSKKRVRQPIDGVARVWLKMKMDIQLVRLVANMFAQ